ncbi:MAG: alanine/ornithine racemase family PLP-dependent enzyme [Clostridiales bacterium]|nr:alanine/ornithine racemase family PLP-dependent enzyme [Clostridiales bacterium]
MNGKYPVIEANLGLLRRNVAVIKAACDRHGVQLAAVTKVTCADKRIADALVKAGVDMLADSRTENLGQLPRNVPRLSLRIADPRQAEDIVLNSEVSLQSGIPAIKALGEAAKRLKKHHHIVLMIDLGDLREGMYYIDRALIHEVAAAVMACSHLTLTGVGTNLTCFGGILPDDNNLGILLDIAQDIRARHGISLPLVSGGNSSSLHLLFEGRLPKGINHLRIGEGLMLGMDTSIGQPFPQLSQQVFTLKARLVEVYDKPSKPEGKTGPNAFGEEVHFEDLGPMRRGILAIGRQDTDAEGLRPLDENVAIIGASSDHLLVDLSRALQYQAGDALSFTPSYGALLKAYTSAYVAREITRG